MIYMDNGATSYPKPPGVQKALIQALERVGNPGRGSHELAIWSGERILETREKIARLFNIDDPFRIAFTMNATHALNIAIHLCYGEILTTSMDHNSVLRPCAKRGFFRVVQAEPDGHISPERVISSIHDMTGAVVMTHVSNVTGEIYNIEPIARVCRQRGILFILDAAQSAGNTELDLQSIPIDILCLTGHKGLYGVQGTGAIYIASHVSTRPYMCGGTGTSTFDLVSPGQMPECYEVGTVNTHGICALHAGIEYVLSCGVQTIHNKERFLRNYMIQSLSSIPGVIVYGNQNYEGTGVVSINIEHCDPAVLGTYLTGHGICARTGFHCAPLAHQTLDTVRLGGTVRFSMNYSNTKEEIDYVAEVIKEFRKKC